MHPLFLSGLGMSCYFLGLIYFLAFVVCVLKTVHLKHVSRSNSTIRLLMYSLCIGIGARVVSFSALCWMDFQLVTPFSAKEIQFYNKMVTILFNVPDYVFISSYLLLILVWTETFQSSRMLWFSAKNFRNRWMWFYMVFNVALWVVQLALYGILLGKEGDIYADDGGHSLTMIAGCTFYLIAAVDIVLPLIIFMTYVYLTISLSGFPIKPGRERTLLRNVSKVTTTWSLGRVLYSIMVVLTFTKGWFNLNSTHSGNIQSMVLVAVYTLAELVPIYVVSDSELIKLFSDPESPSQPRTLSDTTPLLHEETSELA